MGFISRTLSHPISLLCIRIITLQVTESLTSLTSSELCVVFRSPSDRAALKTAVQSTVRPTSVVRSNIQVVQFVVSAQANAQILQRLDVSS